MSTTQAQGGRIGRWVSPWLLGVGFAAVIAIAVALAARSAGLLTGIERPTLNTRFALRGGLGAPSQVTVVALDESSYRRLPQPPLPRSLDARVIRNLRQAGARVIAVDLAFEHRTRPREDQALIAALEAARSSVVGVTAVRRGGSTARLAGRVPFAGTGVRPATLFLVPDADAMIRNFPVGFHGVPAFASVAAGQLRGGPPIVAPPRALIDYPGGDRTVRTLALADVLRGDFNRAAVRGRLVVIGYSAPVLQDLHPTPAAGGETLAGPEIQADAIQTALEGFPLRGAAPEVDTILIAALGLLVPLLALMLGPRLMDAVRILGLGLLVAIGWAVAAQLTFNAGLVVDFSDGMLAIVLATAATWLMATREERRERDRLRALFAAQASDVVARVLDPAERSLPLQADAVIAGYRIQSELGKGGMGVVYLATQIDLSRDVALKLIRHEYALDPRYRERFKRESLLAASLSHQNLVPVFDAGEDAPLLYIAMQLVDGLDLGQRVEVLGPLEPGVVVRLVTQVADALDLAHSHELVHRDVKPANVLVTVDGLDHAYLTDFGLARRIESAVDVSPSGAGVWSGSADFVAPEQLRGEPVTARADIYSLTALTFQSLTGRVPFDLETDKAKLLAHLNAARPSACAVRQDLPPEIDDVIATGMAIDPGSRYSSAGAFADAVATALGIALIGRDGVDRERTSPRDDRAVESDHSSTAVSAARPDTDAPAGAADQRAESG